MRPRLVTWALEGMGLALCWKVCQAKGKDECARVPWDFAGGQPEGLWEGVGQQWSALDLGLEPVGT